MAKLKSIDAEHFRIPLDVPASDSTHGVMTSFELVTVRRHRRRRQEGVGYTYTTGHNGGAIHHLLAREIPEVVAGADCELIEAAVAEGLVGAALWRPRRRGRCSPSRRSTWRCGTSRRGGRTCRSIGCWAATTPGAVLCRRHRPRPLGQGSAGADRRQPREGLPRHQDQGRPREAARGRRAHPGDAQASRRRLPADGRRQHEVVGRRGDPARAGLARLRSRSGWRSRPFPTTSRATPGSCATAGCRWRPARTSARCGSSSR